MIRATITNEHSPFVRYITLDGQTSPLPRPSRLPVLACVRNTVNAFRRQARMAIPNRPKIYSKRYRDIIRKPGHRVVYFTDHLVAVDGMPINAPLNQLAVVLGIVEPYATKVYERLRAKTVGQCRKKFHFFPVIVQRRVGRQEFIDVIPVAFPQQKIEFREPAAPCAYIYIHT